MTGWTNEDERIEKSFLNRNECNLSLSPSLAAPSPSPAFSAARTAGRFGFQSDAGDAAP